MRDSNLDIKSVRHSKVVTEDGTGSYGPEELGPLEMEPKGPVPKRTVEVIQFKNYKSYDHKTSVEGGTAGVVVPLPGPSVPQEEVESKVTTR